MQDFGHGPQPDHKRYVRKVILPSGETIEVVSFEDLWPAGEELHVCPECNSQLVYPTAWEEADRAAWEVALRCPNCEWSTSAIFDEQTIQRFDDTLDAGTEALISDLRQLARANMEEDVERFSAALYGGHLLPEDF